MTCPKCQKEIADRSNYCYYCGERTVHPEQAAYSAGATMGGQKRLVRSVADRKLGGVCAGLADYLGMDVAIVRVLAALSVIFYGIGFFAYLVAWMVIPEGDVATAPVQPHSRRLHRSLTDRRVGGVCGGVAEFLEADPTIIRLIWALSFFVFGVGGLLYLLLWFVLPLGDGTAASIQTAS
jgi:phage shock protein PspC (stress-responsive transcriptional regulator)